GIVLSSALMLTIMNVFIIPIYTARIMNFRWCHYLQRLLPVLLVVLGISAATYAITSLFRAATFFELGLAGMFVTGGYLLGVYQFGLSREERELTLHLVRGFFKTKP
ncbi:MAG: hypothetical protein MUO62_19615, partial [Anaerolineales bacterium]|nr:hypothetical protein [Anaerolineales bacterium]